MGAWNDIILTFFFLYYNFSHFFVLFSFIHSLLSLYIAGFFNLIQFDAGVIYGMSLRSEDKSVMDIDKLSVLKKKENGMKKIM